jgi:hypothetical protein
MMVNLRFRDETLSDSFEREGYAIVRRGPGEPLSMLRDLITSRPVRLGEGIYYSLMSNSFEDNMEIAVQVRAALDGILDRIFIRHQAYNPSFLIKPPRVHQEFMLHQDWCFTDTDCFRMGTVWVPLCDVDESNGCLTVVPKSHRAFRTFISGNLHTARIPMAHLPEGTVRPLPMRFGDVLIFNPLVFHGSFPNDSEQARAIATVNVLPQGAPFCYYHQRTHSEIDRMALEENAVLKGLPDLVAGRIPDDAERQTISYIHSMPTADQLTDRLAGL